MGCRVFQDNAKNSIDDQSKSKLFQLTTRAAGKEAINWNSNDQIQWLCHEINQLNSVIYEVLGLTYIQDEVNLCQ